MLIDYSFFAVILNLYNWELWSWNHLALMSAAIIAVAVLITIIMFFIKS